MTRTRSIHPDSRRERSTRECESGEELVLRLLTVITTVITTRSSLSERKRIAESWDSIKSSEYESLCYPCGASLPSACLSTKMYIMLQIGPAYYLPVSRFSLADFSLHHSNDHNALQFQQFTRIPNHPRIFPYPLLPIHLFNPSHSSKLPPASPSTPSIESPRLNAKIVIPILKIHTGPVQLPIPIRINSSQVLLPFPLLIIQSHPHTVEDQGSVRLLRLILLLLLLFREVGWGNLGVGYRMNGCREEVMQLEILLDMSIEGLKVDMQRWWVDQRLMTICEFRFDSLLSRRACEADYSNS